LIGDTDDRKLLNEAEKKKLRVDTTRAKMESRLSGKPPKAVTGQARVIEEMHRAIYQDS
jgi:hypothetical protein